MYLIIILIVSIIILLAVIFMSFRDSKKTKKFIEEIRNQPYKTKKINKHKGEE